MLTLHLEPLSPQVLLQKENASKSMYITSKDYILCSFVAVFTYIVLSKVSLIWQADYLFTKGQNAFDGGDRQTGLILVQNAILKSPKEAFFYDELAQDYAELSILLANDKQSTNSALLAQKAIESNQYALQLNPAHLNFYKSQARIYIRLAQLDPQLYSYAEQALRRAITLAPTDAKLYYNLALILEVLDKNDEALSNMEYAVAIKTNYLQARNELARMYFVRGKLDQAKTQYEYSLKNIAPDDELLQEKLSILEASISASKNLPINQ
jgi:tetratricopeptide (TPR) repeat protein